MPSFYLTHTDERGERHELVGEWLAPSPEAAISRALRVARVEDDGRWQAHPLPSDDDSQPAGTPWR